MDAESVNVDEIEDYLSSSEKDTSRQLLPYSENVSEEWMINSFSVAKAYIISTITLNN